MLALDKSDKRPDDSFVRRKLLGRPNPGVTGQANPFHRILTTETHSTGASAVDQSGASCESENKRGRQMLVANYG
jgi:hypothetical protein